MVGGEGFEDVGGGGVAFGFAGAALSGEAEVLEEDFAELLGGVDVEGLAGEGEDFVGEAADFGVHPFGKAGELGGFDADAGLFHPGEDGGEGDVDFVVDAAEIALDVGTESGGEQGESAFGFGRLFEIAGHQGVESAGAGVGEDEEGVEEDVLDGHFGIGGGAGAELGFPVVDDEGGGFGFGFGFGGLGVGGGGEAEFLEEAEELPLAEERGERFGIGFADFEAGGGGVEGDAAIDGGETFAEFDLFAVVLEAFAVALAGDFGGAVEEGFEGAELVEEGDGALVANAGSAGDVVGGIAHQGEEVGDPFGGDALEFPDFSGVVEGVLLHGIEHEDLFGDELEHVLVAGDDPGFEAFGGGAAGHGADDVVGLEAGGFENRDAEGGEHLLDHRNLFKEFGRSLGAGGFVCGEGFVAEGGPFRFKDGGEKGGIELLPEASEHGIEDVNGLGGTAAGGAHGGGAGPLPRMEGAEDEVEAVEQKEAGARHDCHDSAGGQRGRIRGFRI